MGSGQLRILLLLLLYCIISNFLNTKDRVLLHSQTTKKDLKIQHAAGGFLMHFHVWKCEFDISSQSKLELKKKRRNGTLTTNQRHRSATTYNSY